MARERLTAFLPVVPEFVTPYRDLSHVTHQIRIQRDLLPPELRARLGKVPALKDIERTGLSRYLTGHEKSVRASLIRHGKSSETVTDLVLYLDERRLGDVGILLHPTAHLIGVARSESFSDPGFGGYIEAGILGLPARPKLEFYPPLVDSRRLLIELYQKLRETLLQEAAAW